MVSTAEWVRNRSGKNVKEWAQQMFTKILSLCKKARRKMKKKYIFWQKRVSHWFAGWVYANVIIHFSFGESQSVRGQLFTSNIKGYADKFYNKAFVKFLLRFNFSFWQISVNASLLSLLLKIFLFALIFKSSLRRQRVGVFVNTPLTFTHQQLNSHALWYC